MDTRSQQIMADVWLEGEWSEETLEKLSSFVRSQFEVVKEARHDFEPMGTTLVFVLSESHCVIHTYPEHNYFNLDLFTCRVDRQLDMVLNDILGAFEIKEVQKQIVSRGECTSR